VVLRVEKLSTSATAPRSESAAARASLESQAGLRAGHASLSGAGSASAGR
jgi:hypothetical protein